jgi:hypothetical protein
MRIEFNWLRIFPVVRIYLYCYETSYSKKQRISWLAEEVLMFQESFLTIDLDGQEVILHDFCSKS